MVPSIGSRGLSVQKMVHAEGLSEVRGGVWGTLSLEDQGCHQGLPGGERIQLGTGG